MGDEVKKLIGANIRKIRESKGLGPKDIKKNTGGTIYPSKLGNYESGTREPDVQTMMLLAKAMQSSVNDILEGIVEKNQERPAKKDRQDLYDILDELPASLVGDARHFIRYVKGLAERSIKPSQARGSKKKS